MLFWKVHLVWLLKDNIEQDLNEVQCQSHISIWGKMSHLGRGHQQKNMFKAGGWLVHLNDSKELRWLVECMVEKQFPSTRKGTFIFQ
jgi:hypothetical protein